MASNEVYDAVIVGSGPNGLAAAITLVQANHRVLLVEGGATVGGGMRSAELTLPGFVHDVCSAVHPLAVASPFMQSLPLEEYGLNWIFPEASAAHAFVDRPAVIVRRSLAETAEQLGGDRSAYERLLGPLVKDADKLLPQILGPPRWPRYPLPLMRFGWRGWCSARRLAKRWFREQAAKALVAGMAAHTSMPLQKMPTAAMGLMFLITCHAGGWPLPRGGAQKIADAMGAYFQSLGGEIVTGMHVNSLSDLPPAKALLFDTSPRAFASIAGERLPARYRTRMCRFRQGPGIFKLDWALSAPIPWRDPACYLAATVHVGGPFEEVAASLDAAWHGRPSDAPFLLIVQPTIFDPSRAPPGKQIAWGYCHVPQRSTIDMTECVERRLERFAPGFRDLILGRHVLAPGDFENYNANYVGGDISGGPRDLGTMLTRPISIFHPYRTPARDLFLCSSSTLPGPGVHGMCGYHAARAVSASVLHNWAGHEQTRTAN